jgi:hypothetical protein
MLQLILTLVANIITIIYVRAQRVNDLNRVILEVNQAIEILDKKIIETIEQQVEEKTQDILVKSNTNVLIQIGSNNRFIEDKFNRQIESLKDEIYITKRVCEEESKDLKNIFKKTLSELKRLN